MKYEKPEIVHLADAATAVQSADALKQQVVSDGIPASQHQELGARALLGAGRPGTTSSQVGQVERFLSSTDIFEHSVEARSQAIVACRP